MGGACVGNFRGLTLLRLKTPGMKGEIVWKGYRGGWKDKLTREQSKHADSYISPEYFSHF